MRSLIVVALSAAVTNAIAATDYLCVNRCTSAGYQYAFCQSKCSYGDQGPKGPTNYLGQTPQPNVLDNFSQGYAVGAQIRRDRELRESAERESQLQAQQLELIRQQQELIELQKRRLDASANQSHASPTQAPSPLHATTSGPIGSLECLREQAFTRGIDFVLFGDWLRTKPEAEQQNVARACQENDPTLLSRTFNEFRESR